MTIEKTTLKRGAFILPLLIARLGPKIKAEPEIPSRKLLTREEELDLGIKIQNGKRLLLKEKLTDEDLLGLQSAVTAINRFVTQNKGLVVSIAKRYLGRGVKFDDLIQEGNIGLIKGAEKFDPDRGTRFSTYATRWIRKSVTQAVNNQGKTIRTPGDLSDEIKRFKYTRQRLHQELRHEPSIPEIAAALGIDPKKITNVYLRVLQLRISSLDEPHNPDDPESGPLSDFIPDASPLPPPSCRRKRPSSSSPTCS